jgi:hypothetical protein
MLPVILLFCGLSIDVGLLELKKLQMQSAADSAALGAELEWERCSGKQAAQAMANAAANGFTNGSNNVTITVTSPPTTGDFPARYDVQYVTITQTVNTIFMGALNGGKATVSVSAAAMMPPCGYLTNTAGISNSYTLNLTNSKGIPSQGMFSRCPVYIKNNLYLTSSESLDEYAINATGALGQSSLLGSYYPTPTYNAATAADPLASLAQPTLGSCNHTTFSVTTSGYNSISPGTYCGSASKPGMTFTGTNVYFNPGLYVITGGLHATASNLSGSGVTLYFTKGSGSIPYGQIIFDGDGNVDLNAPTASSGGSLVNILFFTDRNWVHTAAQDLQFNDAQYYGNGIWYVSGTGVQMTNGSSTWSPGYIGVVTDSIYLDSSTLNLFSDFSTISTGNPFRTQAVLVQ